MTDTIVSTKQLYRAKVFAAPRLKRIGKVRYFVFHPHERRCVGLLVKRPDAAWMFHRKDLFIGLDDFSIEDGSLVIHEDVSLSNQNKKALRPFGLNLGDCVIWLGMPLKSESGELLGTVDEVSFDWESGTVESLVIADGPTSRFLLGTRRIPADMLRGFKRVAARDRGDEQDEISGFIFVSDEVLSIAAEGGVAEAAGKASAVVAHKTKSTVKAAQPIVSKTAKKAGQAIDAGSFALGKQLGRASGMFSSFMDEYKKEAYADSDDDAEGASDASDTSDASTKGADKSTSKS